MSEINLNSIIEVNLTENGESILKKHYEKIAKKNPKFDSQIAISNHEKFADRYTFQLWEFMNIFGDSIHNGGKNICYKNAIYIEDYDLITSEKANDEIQDNMIVLKTKRQELSFIVDSITLDEKIDDSDFEYFQIERNKKNNMCTLRSSYNMFKLFL